MVSEMAAKKLDDWRISCFLRGAESDFGGFLLALTGPKNECWWHEHAHVQVFVNWKLAFLSAKTC